MVLSLNLFLGSGLGAGETDFALRSDLSLDGVWQFRLDPKGEGVPGRWHEPGVALPDRIQVPGNWQAQGFGPPQGIARHDYQGRAWYRRTFTVPEAWSGRRTWLRLQSVCNHGEALLNGRPVGRIETFITPYEFDVTEAVRPGKENTLAVVVDSRPASKYVGMMQFLVPTGGITGRVSLQSRPDLAIDRVTIRPEPGLRAVRGAVTLRRHAPLSAWQGTIRLRVIASDSSQPIAEAESPVRLAGHSHASEPVSVLAVAPSLRPWSPEEPALYTVEVALVGSQGLVDRVGVRTGFREFRADAKSGDFRLNGRPYFLRGCGYDSLEPVLGSPPPDKRVYVERLRNLKHYGFNAIRFLSHSPLKEFFEAADEVGFLVQSEGEWFLGGTPMSPETSALFQSQVPRMIREFENHPSWFSFSCFNEAFGAQGDPQKQAYIRSAFQTFRAMKPDHFFVASDGGGDQWPTDIISDRWVMDRADAPDRPASPQPQQVFRGRIDELAIFRDALPDDAMRSLADVGADSESYKARILRLKPAAYWRFDPRPDGTIADESGGRCDLSLAPGADRRALAGAGRFAGALACGTTPETVPGISLAAAAEKGVIRPGGPFSVSAWVRPDGFARWDFGTFFSWGAAENGRALIFALNGETGDGRLLIGRFFDNILTSKGALAAGRWNHVGLTYDGRRIRLFLDGRPDAAIDGTLDLPACDGAVGRLVDRGGRAAAEYRSRPHVWHEFNNTYIAPLPDLEIEKRLTGAMTQDWGLQPHRRRLEVYGLMPRYEELRRRSIELYREYVKQVFESARRMPRLDGYSWWVVSDIPGGVETDVTSYGILDMLYQPEKFPDREWFLQFNGESAVLSDLEIDHRVLRAGETRKIKAILAHYGVKAVERGRLRWQVTSEGRTLQQGTAEAAQADPGGVRELATLTIGPLDFPQPARLSLEIRLESDTCRAVNRWRLWGFPEKKRNTARARVVNLTGEPLIDARYGSDANRVLSGARVALAAKLTPDVVDFIRGGGRAVLLDRDAERSSQSRPAVIHENGRPKPHSAILRNPGVLTYWAYWLRCNAQVVERHPALADFPHDGFSDFQLMRLFGSSVATVDFTPRDAIAGRKVRPIIWGLSLIPWTEDATRFNLALARGSVLSECRIGRGNLLVCNLWVLDGLSRRYPEAGYLLDCLVDYAASDRVASDLPPLEPAEVRDLFQMGP